MMTRVIAASGSGADLTCQGEGSVPRASTRAAVVGRDSLPSGSPSDRDTLPVQSAEARHRRLAAWTVVGIASLCVGFAGVTRPYAEARYEQYLEELPDRTAEELSRDYRLLAAVVSAGSALPLLTMASVLMYQAIRTQRANRFPYQGMWILRDAPIETGDRVRRRTRRLFAAATGLAILGFAGALFLFALFMRALESAGGVG